MCNKDYNSTVNTMKTNDGTVWYDREMSNTAGGHTYKYILPFLAPPSSGGICFSEPDILKSAGQQGCHCPDHSSAATSTAAITQEMLPRVSTHQTATRSHLQSVRSFLQSEDYSVIAGLDESARGLERRQIGWSSAQSRPLRAESCEATCICCYSCHLWTCWTSSITVSLCCLSEVETEHREPNKQDWTSGNILLLKRYHRAGTDPWGSCTNLTLECFWDSSGWSQKC